MSHLIAFIEAFYNKNITVFGQEVAIRRIAAIVVILLFILSLVYCT